MWLGIDDTDSRKGMCTTHLAGDIIMEINKHGMDIIGMPRLVRLNPNIPWKTRGNGAIAIQFGKGKGKRKRIGYVNGDRYCYAKKISDGTDEDIKGITEGVDKIVRKRAMIESEQTNPGLVISEKKPPYWIYKKAVKSVVSIDEAKNILEKMNASYIPYKNGRGVIGATAAIAWHPYDKTYELITYRNGGKRWVDEYSVKEMDEKFKITFDNYDYENSHIQITPNSPCPIMYGIRGDNEDKLVGAMNTVISGEIKRWLLFETNQGTDEHLQKKRIGDVIPYESAIITGKVCREPRTIKGGHVIFSICDGDEMECAAYEPTKNFRETVRQLRIGDRITVYGGVRKKPITLNVEKIKIHELAEIREKKENPICQKCGKHMKSIGKGKGYRCTKCGERVEEKDAIFKKAERWIKPGFYEVPVVARRHLSKPLKRFISIPDKY
ncbi:MAG: tRNA(Ile)(2)-agmatinylcytidine synthase [Candidatus Thermoplasmatota archaeon]|nr:tRNA(Ile)(2)-agmatinylcytidine synthase [Candidatus Thermoplasmatota archaeon]